MKKSTVLTLLTSPEDGTASYMSDCRCQKLNDAGKRHLSAQIDGEITSHTTAQLTSAGSLNCSIQHFSKPLGGGMIIKSTPHKPRDLRQSADQQGRRE
jgi:hypothetical protein